MNTEQQKIEYKSLQKIRTGEKGFKELSTTCVALANAQGGQIMIGVEDKTKKPAPNQFISQEEANSAVTRLRGLCFNVGLAVGDVCADETGSQYFAITVFPSLHSYATTSDGKMYIRVADKCEPVRRISNVLEKRKELSNGNLYQHSLSWKMRIRRISQNSLMIYANLIE